MIEIDRERWKIVERKVKSRQREAKSSGKSANCHSSKNSGRCCYRRSEHLDHSVTRSHIGGKPEQKNNHGTKRAYLDSENQTCVLDVKLFFLILRQSSSIERRAGWYRSNSVRRQHCQYMTKATFRLRIVAFEKWIRRSSNLLQIHLFPWYSSLSSRRSIWTMNSLNRTERVSRIDEIDRFAVAVLR